MKHLLLALGLSGSLVAAELPTRSDVETLINQVQAWSLSQQQPDGALIPGTTFTLGVTALTAQAMLESPGLPADHPAIQKAVAYVLTKRQPDNGIYDLAEGLATYGTSIALRLFATVGTVDREVIKGAVEWIRGRQNTTEGTRGFGGFDDSEDQRQRRENISVHEYVIAGLKAAGIPTSDPALVKAMKFNEQCEKINNGTSVHAPANDAENGVAIYSPYEAAEALEKGDTGSEKLRGSGAMTYTLISNYLALDLTAEDPRVAAALGYVKRNYQFTANPGMPAGKEQQGLFHYYALMARTFSLLRMDHIDLPDGRTVDWRADLFAAIQERMKPVELPSGGIGAIWTNSATRWGEGIPHLASIYVLSALKAIHSRLPASP